MRNSVCIYTLASSEDRIPRYIGQTTNLSRRLPKHFAYAEKHPAAYLSRWINSVRMRRAARWANPVAARK